MSTDYKAMLESTSNHQPTVSGQIEPVVRLPPEAGAISDDWVLQRDYSIFLLSAGSTVLILFRDRSNGITKDNGKTVDISWVRTGDTIHATTGDYVASDIVKWKAI